MTFTNRHIVVTYSLLCEGLDSLHKTGLIEYLTKSLKTEEKSKDERFYSSFGAFASDKSAEEISKEIKSAIKFRKKEISF